MPQRHRCGCRESSRRRVTPYSDFADTPTTRSASASKPMPPSNGKSQAAPYTWSEVKCAMTAPSPVRRTTSPASTVEANNRRPATSKARPVGKEGRPTVSSNAPVLVSINEIDAAKLLSTKSICWSGIDCQFHGSPFDGRSITHGPGGAIYRIEQVALLRKTSNKNGIRHRIRQETPGSSPQRNVQRTARCSKAIRYMARSDPEMPMQER